MKLILRLIMIYCLLFTQIASAKKFGADNVLFGLPETSADLKLEHRDGGFLKKIFNGPWVLSNNGTDELIIGFLPVEKNVDYVILDNDFFSHIYATSTASDRTYTLPTLADSQSRKICFLNNSTQKNDVIIDGEGAETIMGFLTVTLDFKGASLCIIGATAEWQLESTNLTSVYKEYPLTVTETNWTTSSAFSWPFRTMGGQWASHNVIQGSVSIAIAGLSLAITGMTFSATRCSYAVYMNGVTFVKGFAGPSSSLISTEAGAALGLNWYVAQTCFLDSKPTFVE